MTDITTLADGAPVTGTDQIMLVRGGQLVAVTFAELTASLQQALTLSGAGLLGRATGSGAPQPVAVGSGLGLGGGSLVATGTDHLEFELLTAFDQNAEFIVNSAGGPGRIPFPLLRALLLAAGQPLANVTWAAQGTPGPLLGALGDMAMDPLTVPGALLLWQRGTSGWTKLLQVPGGGGLVRDGVALKLDGSAGWPGWPSSTAALFDGDVWEENGFVKAVPGATPDPNALPIFYGQISSALLLALGAANLPLQDPQVALQLWLNGVMVCISDG